MNDINKYVLAIDQGTTSSRAILFDKNYQNCAVSQQEFKQYYPQSGWVEHDPEDIWQSTLATCQQAMQQVNAKSADIASIGITNQRETTVIWDRKTGKAIHNAIVWQDRRTSDFCADLRGAGNVSMVPNASSPQVAASRAPSTWSRIQATLVAEK